MKPKPIPLSQRYVTALRTRLKPGARDGVRTTQALGRQAVALGMGTLGLARLHEHSLGLLNLSPDKKALHQRAEIFFAEVNRPIEESHRAAQQGKTHLLRLAETLGQRTEELAATTRPLQRGAVRRKVMEAEAEKSGQHYKKTLEESLQLQKRLRQLTHRVIVAQEDERKCISHELHDEIAQTLLGINVRLLSLKQESRANHQGLKTEIASTQRLVANSAKSVRRVAREFRGL